MGSDRRIVGFHQDAEGHWVAELECGHTQHVRHSPPWHVRPWVLTDAGRAGRLGTMLPCRRCAETEEDVMADDRNLAEQIRSALVEAALAAYEDAGVRGLCAEGAWEVAVSTMRSLDLAPIVTRAARSDG
jgi:Protein of unknown function (DUF3565)